MLVRRQPDFRRIRKLAAELDLNSIIRDIDKIAPETAFDSEGEDPDDLFAAPEPPAVKEAEKPAEKAPKKPESDQMEFDF